MKRCFAAWLTVLLILLTLTYVPISVTAYESIQDDGIGSQNGTIETRVVSPPAIWLDNTSLSLEVGQSAILKATLDEVASNSQVIWSSSNQSVVSVTSSGFITGLGAGSATISASLDLEILGYTCTAQCNVVVSSSRFVVDGTYFIQNVGTCRYMNIEGPSTASGAAIQQWDFGVVDQDKWILSYHESGYYTIRSVYSGKYIGVENNSSISNANIKQYTSSTGSGTRWNFMLSNSGNIILTARSTGGNGVVLSVPLSYNANGTDLIQYSYSDNSNFRDEWKFALVSQYRGTFSNWNSSSAKIGYWNSTPSVYSEKKDSSASFYYNIGYSSATSQWSDVFDITFTTASEESADIVSYGLTPDQYLELTGNVWGSGHTGFTSWFCTYEGYGVYGNEIKEIWRHTHANVYIIYIYDPNNVRSPDALRKTVTHEFGHALGYFGHSPTTTDVMYAGAHENYLLKTAEINHLKQVYDLMN